MRQVQKLYVLAALAACSVLYFMFSLTSHGPGAHGSGHTRYEWRVVVFGDSWADSKGITDPRQGKVWTDLVCSKFSCVREDMAASAAPPAGALVDNDELKAAVKSKANWADTPVDDFKAQVENWLINELTASGEFNEGRIKKRQSNTIFTISFGVWDIMKLAGQKVDIAKESINRSVSMLFQQLSYIADQWSGDEMKIVLTLAPDVSFLPIFQHMDVPQKDVVALSEEWNKQVKQRSEKWKHGEIYLVDTNAFLLDQLRERQLWVAGYTETKDFGKNGMDWVSVDKPCVAPGEEKKSWGRHICDQPEKYVFWDEMHLGPTMHDMLGNAVFKGIEPLWINKTAAS